MKPHLPWVLVPCDLLGFCFTVIKHRFVVDSKEQPISPLWLSYCAAGRLTHKCGRNPSHREWWFMFKGMSQPGLTVKGMAVKWRANDRNNWRMNSVLQFTPVVLKVWSPSQQQQHHLGTYLQCKFSGPTSEAPGMRPKKSVLTYKTQGSFTTDCCLFTRRSVHLMDIEYCHFVTVLYFHFIFQPFTWK